MLMSLPGRGVVLWGIGHTNAHVLRMWRMEPIPNTRLTCVSSAPISTYSGMLPGVLAGQYSRERMELDLVRLCAAAGARLIVGSVIGLDVTGRELRFEDRPPLPFDVLSIGIGSVPSMMGVEIGGEDIVTIKPMPTFLDRLAERLRHLGGLGVGRPLRLAVVGGGAGGVEIAFCVGPFVKRILDDVSLEISLILDKIPLLPGVDELLGRGIESTLAPANRNAEAAIHASSAHRAMSVYLALFDPQTCGGFHLGVGESRLAQVLARLAEAGAGTPTVIGRLRDQGEASVRIRVK